jgi:hypothetical protein
MKCDNLAGQAVSLRHQNRKTGHQGNPLRGTLRRAGESAEPRYQARAVPEFLAGSEARSALIGLRHLLAKPLQRRAQDA